MELVSAIQFRCIPSALIVRLRFGRTKEMILGHDRDVGNPTPTRGGEPEAALEANLSGANPTQPQPLNRTSVHTPTQPTMYSLHILALTLASALALAAANPVNITITARCGPGKCAALQGSGTSYCIGYGTVGRTMPY
ncbi:hypothetical protein B0H13DRAFT_1880156 [Mycena leptocephala]|nr:hypothetical protein B0H13DRAFT_1880156 [Mycena leptocephala]